MRPAAEEGLRPGFGEQGSSTDYTSEEDRRLPSIRFDLPVPQVTVQLAFPETGAVGKEGVSKSQLSIDNLMIPA